MTYREWPANDYAIGSFIQATVAEPYLQQIHLNPQAKVLDVGCGNGAFTEKILQKVPEGSVLGIDASENMLDLARQLTSKFPQFSVKKADITQFHGAETFDVVVSFWCLQWVAQEIVQAFANMYEVLKPGGELFTLFPVGNDPYIQGYRSLKASGKFPVLEQFKPPMDYAGLNNLEQKLQTLPFKSMQVESCPLTLELPSLEIFRKFVNGISFFQEQVPDPEIPVLNEAIVQLFDEDCRKKHGGKLIFGGNIYWVRAQK